MTRRPESPEPILSLPTTYEVGAHAVKVTRITEGRWSVSVDGGPELATTYPTQVDAWEAGVRAADRLPAPRP
ncbi:MAG TPA: hypothetical protein VFP50_03830 [Anaeromyxobacteraceae bacterium]|nr:hypothetical protein [Anaeromyxobacteraceae bacterium]